MPQWPDMEGLAQRLFALKRFVLLIGDAGAMIARLSGCTVEEHQFLGGALEENIRQAKLVLARFPKYPVIILFDVLGQSYRRDRLPPVNMLDRPKIMARKLETLFPGAELKGGLRIGPSEGDVRGFDYLFAAVTASPEIASWQKFLEQIENPVSDARLLPVESVKLLHRLISKRNGDASMPPSQWNILITQHRTGGFRQIVTRDHRMAITRMTSGFIDIDSPGEIAGLLQREIGATVDYITRLGYNRDDALDAIFIGRSDIGAAVKTASLPVRRLTAYTPAQAEALAGISGSLDDSGHFADLLHAAWGASRFLPVLSIWPRAKRQQRLMTLGLIWGARTLAAASLAGLVYGAVLFWNIQGAEAEYLQAETARAALQQEYDAEFSKLDGGEIPISRMRDIIAIHTQYEAADIDLNRLYDVLETVLTENVRWREVDIEIEPPVPVLGPTGEPGALVSPEPEPVPVEGTIVMGLDLSSFRDAERAVDEAARLAGALRAALPDMKTTITRQPLRILPADTFKVKSGENVLAFSGEERVARIELAGRMK